MNSVPCYYVHTGMEVFLIFLGDAAAGKDYLGAEPAKEDKVGLGGGLWVGVPVGS